MLLKVGQVAFPWLVVFSEPLDIATAESPLEFTVEVEWPAELTFGSSSALPVKPSTSARYGHVDEVDMAEGDLAW